MRQGESHPSALAYPVDEARLAHNLRAVRQRQIQRKVRRARLGGGLASLAACALLAWFGRAFWFPEATAPRALTATSAMGLERLRRAPLVASAGAVELDDGSRIHLGGDSRLELIENNGSRVRSLLHSGWARFEVEPGGPRRWIVDAGLAQVEVVGTAFTVANTANRTWIRVHRGRVLVRGPLVSGGVAQLGPGERLEVQRPAAAQVGADTEQRAVTDRDSRAVPDMAQQPTQALADGAPAESVRSKTQASVEPAAIHPAASPGSFSVDRVLERADTLRATHQTERAAHLLRRALTADPAPRELGLIALTLAQLELDELRRCRAAAAHFERATTDPRLPPALREQALARGAEALLCDGQIAAARALADTYSRLYPHGSWTSTLTTWLDAAQR